MVVDRALLQRNDASRERLRRLASRLAGQEPNPPVGYGWTVAAALAHVAFWDRYALYQIERGSRDGTIPLSSDADAINAAALPLWLALSPVEAGEQAVAAAEMVDRTVQAAPAEFVEAALAAGRPRLDRSIHREAHLPEIERALGGEG
jgi:hypothetical protein